LRHFGFVEFFGGSYFVRELLHTLRVVKPEWYVIPWDQLDLSDPEHPSLTIAKASLTRETLS